MPKRSRDMEESDSSSPDNELDLSLIGRSNEGKPLYNSKLFWYFLKFIEIFFINLTFSFNFCKVVFALQIIIFTT